MERKELDKVAEEKERLSQLKEEIDASTERLEQEKRSVKEVQVQNVRLKSLVKIGEDALRAEQDRVRELEELLKIKNGSLSDTPVTTDLVTNNLVTTSLVTTNGDASPANTSSVSFNQESVS